jgi:membrane-bound lytic murein transglycosylase D
MSLLLSVCLLLAGPALAEPASGDAVAIEPEGSIWDYIEASTGVPPSEADVEAASELAEERFAEKNFLGHTQDTSLYTDPVAATADDPLFIKLLDASEFDIPVEYNEWVGKWMRYFLGKGRKYYVKWLGRSTRWRPMMYRELEAQGMPRDLVYLSMIESGYATHARSYASAVGLWQFMSGTGREYGLRVDYWMDERRDPVKATEAGIAYLKELHRIFDDWYLAWAAYNGGPGRVKRTVRAVGSSDWWKIAETEYLHPETRNYVPKLLAAAIIGKHPERYGFTDVEYEEEFTYEVVEVEGSVSLDVLAKCAGTTEEVIREMNPGLIREATPPDGKVRLMVPAGQGEIFAANFAAVPPEQRVTYRRHTVQKGESLGKIAAQYGVSVSDLTRFNRITNPNRIYVGTELVIPVGGTSEGAPTPAVASSEKAPPPAAAPLAAAAPAVPASRSASSPTPVVHHTVARGDTLSGIAARYGVSVSDLKRWNNLNSSNHIEVGQRLTLTGADPATNTASTYTVQRGDTLTAIAARYGVSVEDMKRWNNLSNSSHIVVGQRLKVYTASVQWTDYTVRAGDSLGHIARVYGCSVADLKSWNDLDSSVIQPGQKLRVRKG